MSVLWAEPAVDWRAIWREFGESYRRRVVAQATEPSGEVERELLFCLLGGHGVSFELASSATDVLYRFDVFSPSWDIQELECVLKGELERPQFAPKRVDGSYRRYRYPGRKSKLIAEAAGWYSNHIPLADRIRAIEDEQVRRSFLCQCPGIGMKTASWLLRNLGLAQQLAVIDIHVLRALIESRRVDEAKLPRDYLVVEQRFLAWCSELGAPPAAFDLLLWEWQRAA